jgi:thioredoxin-related protein
MKNTFVSAILFLPLILFAQDGIKFDDSQSWEEVKLKAMSEEKYIFVDCYATWCKPCKIMDSKVYPKKKIGDFFNNRFISIKMQMDSTSKDNDAVKAWYKDAHYFKQEYDVKVFPSYLFFSPQGTLVHKGMGVYLEDNFLPFAEEALDSSKQYYVLRRKFELGNLEVIKMNYLARKARLIRDNEIAFRAADKYTEYLTTLNDSHLLKKENLKFIREFTRSSTQTGFEFFYNNSSKINAIMDVDNYVEAVVENIIIQEEIYPSIQKSINTKRSSPRWNKIERVIKKKYNSKYATNTLVRGKIFWFQQIKDWPNYSRYLGEYLDLNSGFNLNDFALNNACWEIFRKSLDKRVLDKAIYWMKIYFEKKSESKNDSQSMDTYANLLYKVGRIKEAIEWEEKALANAVLGEGYKAVIVQMKNGEPTYVEEGAIWGKLDTAR